MNVNTLKEKSFAQKPGKHVTKSIIFCLLAVAVIVSLGQLILANYFSEKGATLYAILMRKEQLLQENDMLKAELANVTSISYVAEQAKLMGFEKTNQFVFVPQGSTNERVALEPQLIKNTP